MEPVIGPQLVEPGHQFSHQTRRVVGCRRLEHHADLLAAFVEGDDAVG